MSSKPKQADGRPGRQPARRSDRSDWLANRSRIHAAGRVMFAGRRPALVQLEDIAAEAGVSRATLLRHIGSKAELVAALYEARVGDVTQLALDALKVDDPWEALVEVVHTLAGWYQADRGLFDYLRSQEPLAHLSTPEHRQRRDEMVRCLDEVLARGKVAGVVRQDLHAPDLQVLLGYAHVYDPAGDGDASRLGYYTDILLQGLRAPY